MYDVLSYSVMMCNILFFFLKSSSYISNCDFTVKTDGNILRSAVIVPFT